MNCPICAQALEGGELVMVCTPCHKALGGGLNVNATGEFRVPTAAELFAATEGEAAAPTPPSPPAPALALDAVLAPEPVSVAQRPNTVGTCSWCSKHESEVRKLLGRGGAALCDECVSLASDIMEAELGANWR